MTIRLSDHFDTKKMLRFAFPSIIMMVFTSIYGVVDGLFVSNCVGKTAFASINLIMPLLMVTGGIGFMIAAGGSALIGKTLGEKNQKDANRYFSMLFFFNILLGVFVTAMGLIFLKPICILLGATEEMLPYCLTYGRISLWFTLSFILQNFFQTLSITAERPKLGLYATVAAGCANMILDALFVGLFRWGVAGAAVATGLSQCIGAFIPLIYYLRPNGSLLRLGLTLPEFRPILQSCYNGSSELLSNISSSLVGMLYNVQLMRFAGENGVAAYGVLMYVQFIFVAIFIGYSIGVAPVFSYHFGAENRDELKNLLRRSVVMLFVGGVAMFAVAELMASVFAGLFVGYDATLYAMTVRAFRCAALGYFLMGLNIFGSGFFTALNNGLASAIISFVRTVIFQTSAILILPLLFGEPGLWWAVPAVEIFAAFLNIAFLLGYRKKYGY